MDDGDLLSRFAVALGIGLLIGIERGWRTREEAPGSRTAGIRTFAITGLLGATIGALARVLGAESAVAGGLVLGFGFAAFAAVFALFSLEENRAQKEFSATTMVAALATFALGAFALVGEMRAAAAVAVAVTALLALREVIHAWVERITWPELRSGLTLLAMTFIALPLVPNETVGPLGGVNPREVWLIAIVLAGVSFLGYAAVRYFGARRGVLLAAAAGGLVSSTAVAATNARRAAAGEGAPHLLAAGVAVATAISFLRVLAIVMALNPALLRLLAPSLGMATIAAVGYAFVSVFAREPDERTQQAVEFHNPFDFFPVVGFALFLAAIMVLGRWLSANLGSAGAILGAAAVGLADVDAITVSMTRLAPAPLSPATASLAILAAVATNTAVKAGIGTIVGRGRFAVEVAVLAALCLAAAGGGLWVVCRV